MITSYAAGRPAWVDLATPGRSEAMVFYGALLGWTFRVGAAVPVGTAGEVAVGAVAVGAAAAGTAVSGDLVSGDLVSGDLVSGDLVGCDVSAGEPRGSASYTLGLLHGAPIAGIADSKPSPEGFPAPPTAWTTYLRSPDVDTDALRIEEAGGTVLDGPNDIAGRGRMVVAADPTGAVFGLWQPTAEPVADSADRAGAPYWHECVTGDPQTAATFYSRLFDHPVSGLHAVDPADAVSVGAEGGIPYEDDARGLRAGPGPVGRVSGTPLPADMPPSWLVYFAVADADAAAALVLGLGGSVLEGPTDTPHGRLVRIRDPQGAVFAVIDPHGSGTRPGTRAGTASGTGAEGQHLR